MSDTTQAINVQVTRGIATMTLARPARRNAFDDAMIADMHDHFRALASDRSIRALVLEGSGGHFSAGADLHWMQRMAAYDVTENLADAEALASMLHALYQLPFPTLAVIEGSAFGGAVGLIACCDMAIATDNAVFALSEVKIGLVPATISPYVVAAIGARACGRLFLTGERFNADYARQIGLISDTAPASELPTTKQRVLDEIMRAGPHAVRAAKALLRDVAGRDIDDKLIKDTCQRIANIRVSAEGQAGLRAFLSKQPPPWTEGTDTP